MQSMNSYNNQLEVLRTILENSLQPQLLNTHPWTRSLIVRQAIKEMPELQDKSTGEQLIMAISRIFTQMMPTAVPRRGKRLDTRWGEFGMLAAEYFPPLLFGEHTPASLREAWGHIDQSILFFVYGEPGRTLTDVEKEPYKLVGNEPGIAPNSTLSDWHRNGLECLFEMIQQRENYLSGTLSKPALIAYKNQSTNLVPTEAWGRKPNQRVPKMGCYVILVLGIMALGGMILGGLKAFQIYKPAKLVKQDA